MTRPKILLALAALLFAVALPAAAAGGPTPQIAGTAQVAQPVAPAEAIAPAPQVQQQGTQSPLLTDAQTLLFGAQPQIWCQCRTVSDCPPSCNAVCLGAPCGRCAC